MLPLAILRRVVLSASRATFALTLVVGLVHCSGGTSSGSSPGSSSSAASCSTLCDCVSANGGSATQCMSQCASIASSSTSPQSDCEATLASNGFSKCSSACATFGKSAPSPGGATSGGTAQLGDFCAKCASCVGTSGFKEGFCTPFVSAEGFDLAACTAGGSVAELARPSIAKSELSSLSCSGFDEAE